MAADGVIVVIHYQAQPGQADVLWRELAALIKTVVETEPACHGIQMLRDADDETRILLYERWTDKASYTGPHMQTPHIQAFIGKAPAFVAGPPAITFWRMGEDVTRG